VLESSGRKAADMLTKKSLIDSARVRSESES